MKMTLWAVVAVSLVAFATCTDYEATAPTASVPGQQVHLLTDLTCGNGPIYTLVRFESDAAKAAYMARWESRFAKKVFTLDPVPEKSADLVYSVDPDGRLRQREEAK